MNRLALKYGCNPNQTPAAIYMEQGELPLQVLNGNIGYINFMDALNSWQLVKTLQAATGICAAASFKHVSPAGAALGLPLDEIERRACFAPQGELSPMACAYLRARGADRLCSFGDWAALSDVCDEDTARVLQGEVSDGIIAPDYTPKALEILKSKRKGTYNIVQIDKDYAPPALERRTIFGITFEQGYNDLPITAQLLENVVTDNKILPEAAKRDMLLAMITLKYTQSNSVCFVKNGQTIGVGAGQQSRVHCTRLAGDKADIWWLRRHPKVLRLQFADTVRAPERDNAIDLYISPEGHRLYEGNGWQGILAKKAEPFLQEEKRDWLAALSQVTVGSDAFFPFGDNVERAARSGCEYIVQAGGSIRDAQVIETANKYHIAMAFTGVRLFHH